MAKKTKNHAYDTNVSPSDLKESLMSLYGTACKKTEYPIFWMYSCNDSWGFNWNA